MKTVGKVFYMRFKEVSIVGGIKELVEWLAKETHGTVDLRYNDKKWCVMVAQGHSMTCVHGTVRDDPMDSLSAAIDRWENRSPENPF